MDARTLPGQARVRHAQVDAGQWQAACAAVHAGGGLLHALWAGGIAGRTHLNAALQDAAGLLVLEWPMDAGEIAPDLSGLFPAAARMQRAARDLSGLRVEGDERPWLRHAGWPADAHPLREAATDPHWPAQIDDYPFVAVAGDGVHEIAVGPVHAGIIEPGHFRFSVVGEKVLRLEQRLGYVHKGIEHRLQGMELAPAVKVAARVSGDSAVAYAWAYSMAAEAACAHAVPPRALWLRALLLERERIANHLGDLGALGNDAGFAFGLAQFSRLKEDWLRGNAGAFGARYPMDAILPGGVNLDLSEEAGRTLIAGLAPMDAAVRRLRRFYDDHSGVQDRFLTCGRVEPALAARLGLIGLAGRASSQLWDRRCDHPHAPYDGLAVRMAHHRNGDVAARVSVRFDEIAESLRLCRVLLETLPPGPVFAPLPPAAGNARGYGWIEGWRGPVLVALATDAAGLIARCHPHDPSWQNWPALEHAVMGNIVPDFPLINKSFNLSYSGVDL